MIFAIVKDWAAKNKPSLEEIQTTFPSVGKAYYDIFDNKKTDFELLEEISYQINKPEGMDWPQTIDKHSGKDRDVKRTFSIWKKGKILYINTFASGSNTPPAEHFDEILNNLITRKKE